MTCKYRFFGDWAKEYDPNEHSVSTTSETRTRQREGDEFTLTVSRSRGSRPITQQEIDELYGEIDRSARALGLYRYSSGGIERVEDNQQSESYPPSQRQASVQESIERLAAQYSALHSYQSRRYESSVPSNTPLSETCTGEESMEDQQPDGPRGDPPF